MDEKRAIAHRPLESIERETLVAEGATGFVAERLQQPQEAGVGFRLRAKKVRLADPILWQQVEPMGRRH